MVIWVRMALKMLLTSPITKIGKCEMRLLVIFLTELIESSLRILKLDSPFFNRCFSVHKLLLANSSIIGRLHCVKGQPKWVVLFEVNEKISELGLAHVIVPKSMSSFYLTLRCLVGSHDHWLGLEKLGQVKNISNTLIDFCKTEILVSIHIKLSKQYCSFFSWVSRYTCWDFIYLLNRSCAHQIFNIEKSQIMQLT